MLSFVAPVWHFLLSYSLIIGPALLLVGVGGLIKLSVTKRDN